MTEKIKESDQEKKSKYKKKKIDNSKKGSKANAGAASRDDKHKPTRMVVIDPSLLPLLPDNNRPYVTNRISTTKYNALNFIPKSLLVQFKRVSNIYFLIITIFCCVKQISPLPVYTSVLPLIFVLVMSMIRDGYEDIKRRQSDNITNNQKVKILRKPLNTDHQEFQNNTNNPYKSLFSEKLWSEVKCGDIMLIEEGEHFSADAVLFLSSSENGDCFVQTSSLDGERALKHKQCLVPITTILKKIELHDLKCVMHSEQPGKNLYEFSGYMESAQFPEQGTIKLAVDSDIRTITLDNKQLLLRGSNLANTEWAIGAVVYTGKHTKLMMNQGQYSFKQSKMEKLVNVICIYLIIIQAIICLLMSIYAGYFTYKYGDVNSSNPFIRAEYIFYSMKTTDPLKGSSDQTQNQVYTPGITGLLTYFYYFILLNTLIPISLVVSLEFVKLIQTPFIQNDLEMYDEATQKQAKCMTMTLHEELANIKYIFADKTGTLTSNIMQFKACSIGSVCYDEDYKEDDYEYQFDSQHSISINTSSAYSQSEYEIEEAKNIGSVEVDEQGEKLVEQFNKHKKRNRPIYNQPGSPSKINRRDSATEILWNFSEQTKIVRELLRTKKYFMNEEINLGTTMAGTQPLILKKQTEYLNHFWLNVSLCHDVIATRHPQSGLLAYQGSSPDEITLLDASKEIGYMFVDKTSDTISLEIFGKRKMFRLLEKIEFTSDRKKMTVVIQDPDTNHIIVYCKGADLAILERLSDKLEQHFIDATKEDLIKFSTKGFRTLCFSMKVLDFGTYASWADRYQKAKLDQIKLGVGKPKIGDNYVEQSQIQILEDELESDLFLLGATALEDKLQEGVPEVIDDFHQAGIKVWMLTGDKLETAENIGFSSKMFNEKMFIFKLQTKDKTNTRTRLLQIENKIAEITNQHATPIIGTQFVYDQHTLDDKRNLHQPNIMNSFDGEQRNIVSALEGFRHESKASLYSLNESWARRPALRRKVRKRLEEIVPDKAAIVERLVRENQFFTNKEKNMNKFVPKAFGQTSQQNIVRKGNIYRPSQPHNKKSGAIEDIIEEGDTFGIIVEGATLHQIMDSEGLTKKFLAILGKCKAVIVCRASPSQKALVVQMVKDNEPHTVTLAIGDGANDVNMIQRAHVGIGIFGKEGYQAAGSSDYAIGQFRFLRRLLFLHGRWNGIRLSNFTLLFFHKNICFTLPQFWFGWECGYSGQSYWDSWYLSMFNTLLTTFAICTYAVWEQDICYFDEKKRPLFDLFFPYLYKDTREKELFTRSKFVAWFIISTIQSLFIYGMPVIAYQYHLFGDHGKNEDLWLMSLCSYTTLVNLHYALICIFTRNWTLWVAFMYTVSYIFFCPAFVFIYNRLVTSNIQYRIYEMTFNNGFFWMVMILEVIILVFPIMFYFKVQSLLFPTLKDLLVQDRLDVDKVLKEADPKRVKAAHDLFKQKQQQQLLQWQAEYKQYQSQTNVIPKPEEQKIPLSSIHRSSTMNVGVHGLPRKGFAYDHHLKNLNQQPTPLNEEINIEFEKNLNEIGPTDLKFNETYDSANLNNLSVQLSQTSINDKLHSYANILMRNGESKDNFNSHDPKIISLSSDTCSPTKGKFNDRSF